MNKLKKIRSEVVRIAKFCERTIKRRLLHTWFFNNSTTAEDLVLMSTLTSRKLINRLAVLRSDIPKLLNTQQVHLFHFRLL